MLWAANWFRADGGATCGSVAVGSVQRSSIEDFHEDDLILDDVQDEIPGPWRIEQDVSVSWPVGTVRLGAV